MNQFVETIKAEYDVYRKEKAEADEKAFRDQIANGVPYVGMPESEIYNTSLGSPTIKAEYDVYRKEKAEADEKAFRDQIANGVPYVGMPESEIYNTSLGSPSIDVRHNTEFVRGKRCTANIYDFMRDNARIFTARCVEGTVIQVWDYRNDPIRPYIPKKSTTTDKENIYDFMRDNARIFTARCVEGTVIQVWDYRNDPIRPYIPKKSTTTDKDDDPYDVNDYSNEEDFYYDHYDDFFDYYDAEEYYDERHQ